MFRIGEFAQIAQVSGRLLRYYDELGLFAPQRIDRQTGYRWYSASQLPRLNRILALKELGLTLEQIGPLIDGEVSAAEIRTLLAERRTAAETQLRLEEARLRQIESRIAQIDAEGRMTAEDVVMKSAEATPFLSTACSCEGMDHAVQVVGQVAREAMTRISAAARDKLVVVSRPGLEGEAIDLDIGFSLNREAKRGLKLAGGLEMTAGELPAAERLATIVRSGPAWQSHFAFGALGGWIESNGFELDGPCREVFLTTPFEGGDPVIEIQLPVRPA